MLLLMFNQIKCKHKGVGDCINNKIELELIQQ